MESFLWFIFILLIVGMLFRYLMPLLLRWFVKRTMKKMNNSSFETPFEQEGKTKISGQNPETKVPKNMGEYVDYENIKDSEN
ncbi:MAG: hypothetical protein PHR53_01310 [Bacteroidales bacterium]|nr:hypothetical protein [Bacteroidales bacterium]